MSYKAYLYCGIVGHDFNVGFDLEQTKSSELAGWIEKNGVTIIHHSFGNKTTVKYYETRCKRRCRYCEYTGLFKAIWDELNPIPEYTFISWM